MHAQLPAWSEPLFEKHRYKSLWGGRGAAKSWTVATTLLIKALESPLRVLCARELQNSIKDSVHRLLSDRIAALDMPFVVTQNEIRQGNGSLFLFEGIKHNVTKIKSMEGIDIVWIEEAQSVSEDSWQILVPTIRKPGSEIWLTWNTHDETDPTYQRFVVSPPPDCMALRVNWDQNPWITPELVQEKDYLYRVDPDAAAHVWGGEPRKMTDAQVLRGRYVVEPFEPPASPDKAGWGGPYLGVDFGFAVDPTVMVRLWVKDRTLYIEHEAYAVGCDIEDTPKLFDSIPDARKHMARADSARPETISHLQRNGYPRVIAADKWPGSVEDGVEHLRSYERIVIHPRCIHAAEEARLWSYKTDRLTGDVKPELLDKHDHVWDAVRYALGPIIQAGKPKAKQDARKPEPSKWDKAFKGPKPNSWKVS
jgi:phage terminase large subunit